MRKTQTFQLHQARGIQKTELRSASDTLDRESQGATGNDPGTGGGGTGTGGGGCVPCGPGQYVTPCDIACYDEFSRVESAGWGVGPMGTWVVESEATTSVDGTAGSIDHVNQEEYIGMVGIGEATTDGTTVEILTKFRHTQDDATSWRVDLVIAGSDTYGGSDGYAEWNLQHSIGFGTLVAAGDTRNHSIYAEAWFEYDSSGIPSPASGIWIWARLVVNAYGAYARFWEDGDPEPVNTAPLTSHYGWIGETWHCYQETDEAKFTPTSWDRIWVDAGDLNGVFEIDYIEVIKGCTLSAGGTGACNETFSRTESGNWGTSEFGPIWQEQMPNPLNVPLRSVNGSHGIVTGSNGGDRIIEFADVWPDGAELPIEVYVETSLNGFHFDNYQAFAGILFDSQPDPQSSADYQYLFVEGNRTGGFSSHDIYLSSYFGGSEVTSEVTVPNSTRSQIDDDTDDYDVRIRYRMESDSIKARVWLAGDSEPAIWHHLVSGSYNPTFVSIGYDANTDSDGVHWVEHNVDNIQITAGCGAGCEGWTVSAPDGTSGTTTDTSGQLLYGPCLRVNGTNYTLPSAASQVYTVYIDGLPTTNWYFDPWLLIVFNSSVAQSSTVTARYISL